MVGGNVMSRRGDNIRKRKDGRWEGRYIHARDVNGKSLYKSVYGKTYSEVKTKLYTIESISHTPPNLNENNFSTIADKWLQEIKQHKKYSTYIKYSGIYYKYVQKTIGQKNFSCVTEDDLKNMLKECDKNNLSYSTICSLRNVLNQIMQYGNNPVSIIYKPYNFRKSKSRIETRITVFTREEQYKLQQYLLTEMDNYKLGIYVCMFTGMRLGEICALRTEEIDLDREVIRVTQTVQRIKSENSDSKTKLLIDEPKTICSLREIPICNILLKVLKEHLPHTCFLLNGNLPMEPRTYQYYFKRVLEQLSIENKNFHSLRHTFATNCIDSGMDVKCLSEILGHSDIKTTLNKYVHPTHEQKMKQINSFASDYGHFDGQS